MKDKIKIGLIGTGGMGRSHLQSLLNPDEMEKVELVAIADPYEKSISAALQILKTPVKVFSRYEDLLEMKDIEAVIIATPNDTHKKITVDALLSGKHVLCEKPMATTVKDCDEMIKNAKRYNRILQIGLELRHYPLYKKMKKLVTKGIIGMPKMMWCKEFRNPFIKKVGEWIIKPERSGDSLVEKDCHHFDLFNWMINSNPIKVCAFGGNEVIYKDTRAISNAWVIVEYENKARACLGLCMFTTHGDEILELGIIGDKGRMESSYSKNKITLWKINLPKKSKYWVDKSKKEVYSTMLNPKMKFLSHQEAVYFEHLNFFKCVKEGKEPEVNGKVGKLSVAVALAAQRSIKEDRVIYLSEIL